jgi:hypothetical protein
MSSYLESPSTRPHKKPCNESLLVKEMSHIPQAFRSGERLKTHRKKTQLIGKDCVSLQAEKHRQRESGGKRQRKEYTGVLCHPRRVL